MCCLNKDGLFLYALNLILQKYKSNKPNNIGLV